MSYQDGWAALNLEMPSRVPRTEYSAHQHWELIKAVTGIDVSAQSPQNVQQMASSAFRSSKHWNYDLNWSIDFHINDLGKYVTKMGHAEFAAEGADYIDNRGSFFNSLDEKLDFDPSEYIPHPSHSALVKRFNDKFDTQKKLNPDGVNMNGTYISFMSGLLEIYGWDDLLMGMGMEQERFIESANRYAKWMIPVYEALADCDSPVIMIHDDIVWTSGPFTHPEWYREHLFPVYKEYMKPLKEAGKKVLYTSDGNYSMFIDDIAQCGFSGFVMEPMTDMKYIAEKYGKTHSFVGNADTRVLLHGTKEQIRAEVKRCMDIGKNCPGFFMAVGNHIPANTPVENAIYYNEVYEELGKRR